jgi:integrase
LALLLCTGQRLGDVIRMGPQHIRYEINGDGRRGFIYVQQAKTKTPLAIPIHPDLQMILDTTPCQHLTFLIGRNGRPYNGNHFSRRMRKWCDAAQLPLCTTHGLRKAAARRLAEAGLPVHMIAAITGHRSLKEVARYTRDVDQKRLAAEAMQLLVSRQNKTREASGKP